MAQLLVLYNKPADTAVFDAHYTGVHVPLALKIPGLRSLVTSTAAPKPMVGTAPYLVAELNFDSMADLDTALASPEGQATAGDLANFAHAGVTLFAFETRQAS